MQRKTRAELEHLILNEVRDLPACKGLKWISIVPEQTTWRADMHAGGDPARQAPSRALRVGAVAGWLEMRVA